MRIVLNGAWRDIAGAAAGDAGTQRAAAPSSPTLETVLAQLGFAGAVVATALNGEFVPARARGLQPVHEGDRLEVLAPMQGG